MRSACRLLRGNSKCWAAMKQSVQNLKENNFESRIICHANQTSIQMREQNEDISIYSLGCQKWVNLPKSSTGNGSGHWHCQTVECQSEVGIRSFHELPALGVGNEWFHQLRVIFNNNLKSIINSNKGFFICFLLSP